MHVVNLREPKALLIPQIQQLIHRAVDAGTFLAPGGFDTIAQDLFNFTTDPTQFMFLGAEAGEMKAIAAGFLPVGNLFPYPTIVMFYNEGTRALSRAVQDEVMDFIVTQGYTRMLAVNTSGRADDVWQRALTPSDAKSERVGSLVLFEVK